MKLTKIGLVILVLFTALAFIACGQDKQPETSRMPSYDEPDVVPQQVVEGVAQFCNNKAVGRLKNTNLYSVRIRTIGVHNNGVEHTIAMELLEPGEELPFVRNEIREFYIYNIDGGLIGWLNNKCE